MKEWNEAHVREAFSSIAVRPILFLAKSIEAENWNVKGGVEEFRSPISHS